MIVKGPGQAVDFDDHAGFLTLEMEGLYNTADKVSNGSERIRSVDFAPHTGQNPRCFCDSGTLIVTRRAASGCLSIIGMRH